MSNSSEKTTIRKTLESLLPRIPNSERREMVLGKLAYDLKQIKSKPESELPQSFYSTFINNHNLVDEIDENEILLGKQIYESLLNLKDYQLGLAPDERKLKRFRSRELTAISQVMYANGYWKNG